MIKTVDDFTDYEVIATGNGEKLERWNDVYLLRPDPQVIWSSSSNLREYKKLNAVYSRDSLGGGHWDMLKPFKNEWEVAYKDLTFIIKPMGFKHTGLFPEQAVNWNIIREKIQARKGEVKVLNLFGYTGGASVAAAKAGAFVCHVDAAKGMVDRCKENARLSKIPENKIRYIVDDCEKFVRREINRQNKYDAIIMDPPSFGRGPNGEVWKIEEKLFDFVKLCSNLLSDNPLFVLINSYTTGLQPTVIENILKLNLKNFKGTFESYEIGLNTNEGIVLPAGCSGLFIGKE